MSPTRDRDQGPKSLRRRLRSSLGKAFLKVYGWKIRGGAPDVDKAVVIAYPHTSNWDFPFTLAIAYALDVDIRWLGKKELFKPPMGWLARWLGGVPVDRSRRSNLVDAVIDIIDEHDRLLVIIPPEGTRGKPGRWKSGFYWIAHGAGVPIILGFLDFKTKTGGLGEIVHPTGDIEADVESMRTFYAGMEGKHLETQGEIKITDGGARPDRVEDDTAAA